MSSWLPLFLIPLAIASLFVLAIGLLAVVYRSRSGISTMVISKKSELFGSIVKRTIMLDSIPSTQQARYAPSISELCGVRGHTGEHVFSNMCSTIGTLQFALALLLHTNNDGSCWVATFFACFGALSIVFVGSFRKAVLLEKVALNDLAPWVSIPWFNNRCWAIEIVAFQNHPLRIRQAMDAYLNRTGNNQSPLARTLQLTQVQIQAVLDGNPLTNDRGRSQMIIQYSILLYRCQKDKKTKIFTNRAHVLFAIAAIICPCIYIFILNFSCDKIDKVTGLVELIAPIIALIGGTAFVVIIPVYRKLHHGQSISTSKKWSRVRIMIEMVAFVSANLVVPIQAVLCFIHNRK